MHKTGTWLLTLLVASPLLVQAGCTWMSGCGAPQEGAPGLAATPAEVVVNSNLPGAYKAAEGATLPLRGLRLHRDQTKEGTTRNTFFAERAVTCEGASGPGFERLEGAWRVLADQQLELQARGQPAMVLNYQLQGSLLRLVDHSRLIGELTRVPTFCTQASDCPSQTIIRPQCVGNAVCTTAQTCGWACGPQQPGISFGDPCGGIAGLSCGQGLRCTTLDARGCPPEKPGADQMGLCLKGEAPSVEGCKGYLCATGEHCASVGGQPGCVPDSQELCATVRCGEERPRCVEWLATRESACIAKDQCHRDRECSGEARCQPEATCVRAPCFQPLVCR